MSAPNSARNRKSAAPERKGLKLFPGDHPYAEQVNSAISTNPEVYGKTPNTQYAIGCSIGKRAASLYSSAGGPVLSASGWLQFIVLNAAESLPERVARGFIVGFLGAIEKLIPVDPQCIKAQVRGIRAFSEGALLRARVQVLESSLEYEKVERMLKGFDEIIDKSAIEAFHG